MDKIDPARIRDILADAEFRKLITQMEGQLTKNVMASSNTAEERDEAWRDYHALKRIQAQMANVAQDANNQG